MTNMLEEMEMDKHQGDQGLETVTSKTLQKMEIATVILDLMVDMGAGASFVTCMMKLLEILRGKCMYKMR